MDLVREKLTQEHECCKPFNSTYGQPALHVFEAFPTATSYADYVTQERKLYEFLTSANACEHVRAIAVATHKTLCGNDAHVAIANRVHYFGGDIDPEIAEAFLGNL